MTPRQLRDAANRPWEDEPSCCDNQDCPDKPALREIFGTPPKNVKPSLTPRQQEAWLLNASGLRNTEIAKAMGITATCVRLHLENADIRIARSIRRLERWLYTRSGMAQANAQSLPLLPIRFNQVYSSGHPRLRYLYDGERR